MHDVCSVHPLGRQALGLLRVHAMDTWWNHSHELEIIWANRARVKVQDNLK